MGNSLKGIVMDNEEMKVPEEIPAEVSDDTAEIESEVKEEIKEEPVISEESEKPEKVSDGDDYTPLFSSDEEDVPGDAEPAETAEEEDTREDWEKALDEEDDGEVKTLEDIIIGGDEGEEPEEPKKKKGGLAVKIIAIVLAALIIIGGAGFAMVKLGTPIGQKIEKVWNDIFGCKKSTSAQYTDNFYVSMPVLKYFYYYSYNQMVSSLSMYGMTPESMGLDTSKDFREQIGPSGESWYNTFMKQALQTTEQLLQLSELAKEKGYEFDDDMKKEIDDSIEKMREAATSYGYADLDAYLTAMYKGDLKEEDVRDVYKLSFVVSKFINDTIEAVDVSDEALDAAFAALHPDEEKDTSASTVDVRYILFSKDNYEDETAPKEKYDEWVSGGADEESFIELCKDVSDDTSSKENGGLYANLQKGRTVEVFDSWSFDEDRKSGDYAFVEDDTYGWFMLYFVSAGEENWKLDVKGELQQNAYNDLIEEAKKFEVKQNDDVIGLTDDSALSTDTADESGAVSDTASESESAE